tara:strand:- start:271 stop:666 length:396 start_codon:yes stop_codon:yes gene_type:complete
MAKKKVAKGKAGKASRKGKSLEALSETDGMTREEEKFEPSTLDQVWGDDGLSKYRTFDDKEYKAKLKDMAKADLKLEAIRVGLLPIDNVGQLEIRLMRQFRAHVSSYRKPVAPPIQTKLSKAAKKILGEGK